MTDNGKFEQWCIIELFGHSQIAGKVTEQAIGGGSFIRVDVPKTSKRPGFTKFFGPSAIYAITPVEKAIALAMAEALNEAPIEEYRLKTVEVGRQLAAPFSGDEPFGDDEDDELFGDWVQEADAARDAEEAEAADEDAATLDDETIRDDRAAAVTWARTLLEGEFVIIDTETTGFDSHDEIIQIAVIDQDGETVFECLVKPEQTIANHRYHGITDEMVQDAPGFPAIHEQLTQALHGKTRVAYNLDYDGRMLNQACDKHDLPRFLWEGGYCAMEMFAQFYGEWNDYHGNYRWKKLREALAHFGLKHEDFGEKEHDAGTDARATLAVIRKMAEWKEPSP